MRLGLPLRSLTWFAAAGLVAAAALLSAQGAAQKSKAAPAKSKPHGPARQSLAHQAEVYWNAITAKRRQRIAKRRNNEPVALDDYVLTQPPRIMRRLPPRPPGQRHIPRIPVLADFLKAAAEQHGFIPDPPESEIAFKRAYARAAMAAGVTRDQAVGIFAFETGGNGTYNVQSGLTHPSRRARAISPAIGYNQLLSTNTVGLLAQNGDRYIAILEDKAKHATGEARQALERKIAALRRMLVLCRSVPYAWAEHDKLAKTTIGGIGIHAAVLDRDLGPLLQAQKLIDSVEFIRSKGHDALLTASELALMNLTGDGNGLDLVTMPREMRALVPTSNFFQEYGYNRNSIARRTAVVSALFEDIEAKMRRRAEQPGVQDMVAAFDDAAKAMPSAGAAANAAP